MRFNRVEEKLGILGRESCVRPAPEDVISFHKFTMIPRDGSQNKKRNGRKVKFSFSLCQLGNNTIDSEMLAV